ncbi:MAG: sulfur-oxidizing protein SoxY [Oceanicoccus sp.]|jgi:sulfur-oxidizing protein SoxY
MKRRTLLLGAATGLAIQLAPNVYSKELKKTLSLFYGEEKISEGRVHLNTPPLAENGNSVSLVVEVDSPMTENDYVQEIRIFADKNPVPNLASFRFFPASGKAKISTRIRLSNSQIITAVARMNDGTLWSGTSETIVTLAACVEPLL